MPIVSIPVVIISFLIGLCFTYFTAPPSKVVLVYPTPENVKTTQYKDKANNCYEFNDTKVACTNDTSKIKEIPIQN